MIDNLIFMQTYSFFGGGAFGNILNSWQEMGVFDYMIPFLLVFAVVYGILTQLKVFGRSNEQTGRIINAIIALSVGLMSLQFDFMSRFFSELFPRVGIGLIVLLLVIIFTGFFADYKSKAMMYTMYGVGAVILIVILASSSKDWGIFSNLQILGYNWMNILPWVALLVLLVVVISAGKERRATTEPNTLFAKLLEPST
jgi:hypothetical protein